MYVRWFAVVNRSGVPYDERSGATLDVLHSAALVDEPLYMRSFELEPVLLGVESVLRTEIRIQVVTPCKYRECGVARTYVFCGDQVVNYTVCPFANCQRLKCGPVAMNTQSL